MKIYRTITKFVHFYIRRVYLCARSGNQPLCVGVYVCVNNRFCTICYFFQCQTKIPMDHHKTNYGLPGSWTSSPNPSLPSKPRFQWVWSNARTDPLIDSYIHTHIWAKASLWMGGLQQFARFWANQPENVRDIFFSFYSTSLPCCSHNSMNEDGFVCVRMWLYMCAREFILRLFANLWTRGL